VTVLRGSMDGETLDLQVRVSIGKSGRYASRARSRLWALAASSSKCARSRMRSESRASMAARMPLVLAASAFEKGGFPDPSRAPCSYDQEQGAPSQTRHPHDQGQSVAGEGDPAHRMVAVASLIRQIVSPAANGQSQTALQRIDRQAELPAASASEAPVTSRWGQASFRAREPPSVALVGARSKPDPALLLQVGG
jgi:hypothetical protein